MQLAHITVGDTPTDLTAGLAAGCYLAQVRDFDPDSRGVLYGSGEAPPDNDDDYFAAVSGSFFTFLVGDDEMPVWAKSTVPGFTWTLALALVT